jgi:uncharacterized protein YndB with AHSA1/START domain
MSHGQRDPRYVLKLTRIISASPKEVFEAWTTAESVKQWMCPEGSSVSFAELDVRVGGAFRIDMHVNGADIVHTGTYREIVPAEKLVFTWLSKHTHFRESLVTLELWARGEATELILLQTQLPDEEAAERHTAGWPQLLEHLTASLQKRNTEGGSRT